MSQDLPKVENGRTVKNDAEPSKSKIGKPLLVLFGIVGSLASVISIPLAIYFYTEAKQVPLLTYYVHPSRAVVVKAGQASKLTIDYANKEIKSDITAVQIAIWNQGKSPIKKGSILKPIVLRTENGVPILEVSIRKISRDVTNLVLDSQDNDKGRVTLSWDILERNDGGIVQLIYAGGPETKITVDGVIEGQEGIAQLQSAVTLQSSEEQLRSERKANRYMGLFVTSMGGLTAMLSVILFVWSLRKGTRFDFRLDWILLVLPFAILATGVYMLTQAQEVGPPFGF